MLTTAEPTPRLAEAANRFDEHFERLYPSLFGLTYRVLGDAGEAEETLQDAFLKLADSPLLGQPDAEVAAWLRRVCLNLSFNRLRDQRRARERLERAGRLVCADPVHDGDLSARLVRREAQARVRSALTQLPDRQRDCLLLRHSGYAYAEIAATLGIAVGSVGVLLARAERAFRDLYREDDDDLS